MLLKRMFNYTCKKALLLIYCCVKISVRMKLQTPVVCGNHFQFSKPPGDIKKRKTKKTAQSNPLHLSSATFPLCSQNNTSPTSCTTTVWLVTTRFPSFQPCVLSVLSPPKNSAAAVSDRAGVPNVGETDGYERENYNGWAKSVHIKCFAK